MAHSEQSEREGEAPRALPVEGATLAPRKIKIELAKSQHFFRRRWSASGSLSDGSTQGYISQRHSEID